MRFRFWLGPGRCGLLRVGIRAFASSDARFLAACCFAVCYLAPVVCDLDLSLAALRLRLVLRVACCLRAHSTSLLHCAFPIAFFFASSSKLCPDFDFSGRELRL